MRCAHLRGVTILGPAIRVFYCDLCIAIHIAMPQEAHHDVSTSS